MKTTRDWGQEMAVEQAILNEVYRQLYQVLDQNDELFMAVVREFGGAQWNFPDHIYDRTLVQAELAARFEAGETLDVATESERYGYGKRWIRSVIKHIQTRD
jgi:Mor family transcriptional regulator